MSRGRKWRKAVILAAAVVLGCSSSVFGTAKSQEEAAEEALNSLSELADQLESEAADKDWLADWNMDSAVLNYLNGSNLTIGGEDATLYLGHALSSSMGMGYQAVTDLTQTLGSCMVSQPVTLDFKGTQVEVRVVNPYEKEAPLSECILAGAVLASPEVSYGIFDDFRIGTAARADIGEELQAEAYRNSETELVFKTSPTYMLYNADISKPYGEQVMSDEDYSMELTFSFGADGVLSGIRMEEPAYLYNGLDDNVSGAVGELNEEQVQSVTATRDDVLGQLAKAFQEKNVNVTIDQRNGSIRLSDEVLFAFGESELSDAGKAYLDSFVGVYADVILGDSFADQIDGIEIGGHTDTVGTFEVNQELSEKRAQAVYDYCTASSANGMDEAQRKAFAEKAQVKGYSFSDPVFDESGEINADASRRVEIRFFVHVEAPAGAENAVGDAAAAAGDNTAAGNAASGTENAAAGNAAAGTENAAAESAASGGNTSAAGEEATADAN